MKTSDLQRYALDMEVRQLLSIIQNKTITLEWLETDRLAGNIGKVSYMTS